MNAKAAIPQRPRSQENLDTRVVLIPSAHKYLTAVIAIVMLAVITWSVVGTIPSKVTGNGIILRSSQQQYVVQAATRGRIGKILVSTADTVESGTVLAEISQPEIDFHIKLTQQTLDHMKTDLEERNKLKQEAFEARHAASTELMNSISAALEKARAEQQAIGKLIAEDTGVAGGKEANIARSDAISSHITDLELKLSQVKIEQQAYKVNLAVELEQARDEYRKREVELIEQKSRREQDRYVRAPVSGVIEEIRVGTGQVVDNNDVILTIAEAKKGSEVLAFLDITDGPLVEKGMDAHLIPTTVEKAEFGSMRGTAISISEAPVSKAQINALLRNEQLSELFSRDYTPYLAHISLQESDTNPSGFEWWTGTRPPFQIHVGTLAQVEIVVREQRPITILIPALTSAFEQ
ncbi:MAG: HlyD family efflux transporter periplasmic adaptor subunit [Pseudomonadota bacterium]